MNKCIFLMFVSYAIDICMFVLLFHQITRLQNQIANLKTLNENFQKRAEDLNNKLKEVRMFFFSFPPIVRCCHKKIQEIKISCVNFHRSKSCKAHLRRSSGMSSTPTSSSATSTRYGLASTIAARFSPSVCCVFLPTCETVLCI